MGWIQIVPVITLAFSLGTANAAETKAKQTPDTAKTAVTSAVNPRKDSSGKAVVIPAQEEKAAPVRACSVAKIAFGTAVENGEIKGEAAQLPAGRVNCWSRLACGGAPIKVRHVWYQDGKKIQDVLLSSKSGSGRVWSNAPVTAGAWKVEVVNDSGSVMGSGEFTVK